ncbi:galactose oxidase/kelch, beta-propeller [Purpureocillium lilacinum]|uniref:Galactose oxidase/kelch, beta-propeller n=1 Tax=Purpureocillium lilacinum TaxID=33203 RepID=A0A179HIM4_PURLI|nr:galactose oxidase/kelch, beta-propeller [Purpureocillium lilacinum]OAQ89884.1 galactose oxidase/kelch, beta-propeller [Purpureocillium lilacinum]
MKCCASLLLGILAVWGSPCSAQFTNWQQHQINTSICYWIQPRAALIRDTVYLDGGDIWWSPGLDSGKLGTVVNDGNLQGIILAYNLSDSFSPDTNVTQLLLKNEFSKARGGKLDSISSEPNFQDGALLGNDAEFFLYGGTMLKNSALYEEPPADSILKYTAYQYGVDKPLFKTGLLDARLDNGVNRYVSYGAGVSAPSENMAWYFSGLTAPGRGPFYSNSNNASTRALNVSNTLISLDLTTQLSEKWSNDTLPDKIKGRSNAEVVWVPVGKRGILVVLGGVVYPEWAWTTKSHASSDEDASKKQSPEFMRTIDIYDVDSKKWYQQSTKDGPSTRARGCAVVGTAADRSSFNIYYYGGFDGIHPANDFYDDVWVLSLPSFTWTQLSNGTSLHARAGHKCFMPYPDQMMVFGGYPPTPGALPSCLDKGPIVLYNITSGQWLDSYDPAKYGKYAVHEKVYSAIGGDASGGATKTKPASGWDSAALGDVFATKYDTSKITTYWPYKSATPTGRPDLPQQDGGSSSKKNVIIPAVVVPVVALIGAGLVAFWCMRRRRRGGSSVSKDSTDEAGNRIRSWIRGQNGGAKSFTVTSSEAAYPSPTPEMAKVTALYPPVSPEPDPSVHHEMADTQVAELGDTSPPAELHDTGLTPVEVIQKHSNFGRNSTRSPSNPSHSSFSGLGDNTSFVSGSSARIDSPVVPHASLQMGSLGDTRPTPPPVPESPVRGNAEDDEPIGSPGPVSPPTSGDARGEDYLSAGEVASASRKKSIFRENDEDMGGAR